MTLSGSLFFRVTDSYAACFHVTDFQSAVRNIGTSAMRSVVGHFLYDDVIGDRNKINQHLHDVIGSSIEVRRFLFDCDQIRELTYGPLYRNGV